MEKMQVCRGGSNLVEGVLKELPTSLNGCKRITKECKRSSYVYKRASKESKRTTRV